jgi:serine/threonine protein kinase
LTEPNSFQNGNAKIEVNQSGQSRFAHGQVVAERFKIESVLGIGGMGVVYKVEQIFLRKIFAMKTLEIEDATGMFGRRFQQEGAAVSRLDHPNVVKIYDFGLIEGKLPFYVMDFIDGTSLAALLKQRGSLEVDDALKIFIRVSMALQHAHETDIVHRDIKPSNIMLQSLNFSSDTCVKIVDFGIAKLKTEGNEIQNLTRTGDVFGSPLYMSPEQCLGIGVDHRTDIYSFGCALFETLTGSPPHVGENALSTMIKHREQSAPTLTEGSLGKKFSPALEAVVQHLLCKDPNERYQNFSDITEDLIALSNGKKPMHVQGNKFKSVQPKTKSETAVAKQSMPWLWLLLPLIGLILISAFAWYALKSAPKPIVAAKPAPPPVSEMAAEQPQIDTSPEIQELYDKHLLQKKIESDRCYDKTPYSVQCLNASNQKIRVFQFPQTFSLGTLESEKHRYIAQGDVIIPDSGPLEFKASFECCERPSLLDKFQPDEIGELSVRRVESARDEVLSHVDKWKDLRTLNITGTQIGDRGLGYLAQNSPLIDLRVADTPVTGKGIAAMKCLNHLERIETNMLPEASYLLKALRGSKSLQTLNVPCSKLTDNDLKNLSTITSLKDIDISENKQITDAGIRHLTLPKLRGLAITQCNVTEASFEFMKTLPSLNNILVGEDWSIQKQMLFQQMMPKVHIGHDSGMRRIFKMM